MYKLLLILKYLRKRRIAWVSLIAVMLCTTMVLVVISVMGGWLRMFRESFHGIAGDVVVSSRSLVGFAHYEEMLKDLSKLPEVQAAAPVVRTFGLVNIDNQIRRGVEVVGYPANIQEVNGFRDSLFLKGGNIGGYLVDQQQAQDLAKGGESGKALFRSLAGNPPRPRADASGYSLVTETAIVPLNAEGTELARGYLKPLYADLTNAKVPPVRIRTWGNTEEPEFNADKQLNVRAISRADKLSFDLWPNETYMPPPGYRGRDVRTWKGIVAGDGVVGLKKNAKGIVDHPPHYYRAFIDLTVLPLSSEGANVNLATDRARDFFWIVDSSRTKVHLFDSNTVYLPFDALQSLLQMDAAEDRPARTTDIQIALKPRQDARVVKNKIRDTIDAVAFRTKLVDRGLYDFYQSQLAKADARLAALGGDTTSKAYRDAVQDKQLFEQSLERLFPYKVQTWEEVHGTYLGAVEKEKGLVTILFGMISIVAVFLIFCIFYMIVVEKTRDIGIIKSVGATSNGVAGIFLGYGLAIGIVGSGLGLLAGWLIVRYINELHGWLGRFGVVVWNPEVYLFDDIPNRLIFGETAIIVGVAIVASVLGALIPAIRAARLHPIEALRWE